MYEWISTSPRIVGARKKPFANAPPSRSPPVSSFAPSSTAPRIMSNIRLHACSLITGPIVTPYFEGISHNDLFDEIHHTPDHLVVHRVLH